MVNRETANKLRARLVGEEGLRLKIYRDSRGRWTIGYGRCLDTDGITTDEALYLLQNDIVKADKELMAEFSWYEGLDEVRQIVLCDMCFQMGVDGVAKFEEMIKAILTKDWEAAGWEMVHSAWAKETPERAAALAKVMTTGVL